MIQFLQQPADTDQRIRTSFMNVNAGMTAQQSGNLDFQCGPFALCRAVLILAGKCHKVAAGAGIAKRAKPFPVQIDEILCVEILGVNCAGGHAVLFVNGK